jgi:hypothetical protein
MANPRNPNDPYRADDLTGPDFDPDAPYRRRRPENEEMQVDPQLAEGQASSARVAIYALAIAIILGAIFYGLNNSSIHPNGASTAQKSPPATAQNTSPAPPPAAPSSTTGSNKGPSSTTGSAPPQPPPASPAPANPPGGK